MMAQRYARPYVAPTSASSNPQLTGRDGRDGEVVIEKLSKLHDHVRVLDVRLGELRVHGVRDSAGRRQRAAAVVRALTGEVEA